jgi:hypothetical protein
MTGSESGEVQTEADKYCMESQRNVSRLPNKSMLGLWIAMYFVVR